MKINPELFVTKNLLGPWSYVGAGTLKQVSGLIPMNAATKAGDLLVICSWNPYGNGGNISGASLASSNATSSSYDVFIQYKIATSADVAAGGLNWTYSFQACAAILTFRGTQQIAPLDQNCGTTSGTSVTTLTGPSLTANVANDLGITLFWSTPYTSGVTGINGTPVYWLNGTLGKLIAVYGNCPTVGANPAHTVNPNISSTYYGCAATFRQAPT